jgi:hypothetical protein
MVETPNPPNDPLLVNEWIKILGTIGKTAKKNARDIITKQIAINYKKQSQNTEIPSTSNLKEYTK